MSKFKPGPALAAFDAAIEPALIKPLKTAGVTADPAKLKKALISASRVEARLRASFEIGLAAHKAPRAAASVDEFHKALSSSACAWAFWGTRGFEAYVGTKHASALLGGIGSEDFMALANARAAYEAAMRDFKVLDAYVSDYNLDAAQLNQTLMFWMEHPNLSVDDIMDRMRFYLPPETPVRARVPAPNPSMTGSIEVSDDVIKDSDSRKLLNQIFQFGDEVGGTGAIEDIRAKVLPEGGESVALLMEPLPNRMTRAAKGKLQPGQSKAPDFNRQVSPAIGELDLMVDGKPLEVVDPHTGEVTRVVLSGKEGGWNRLHLVGPGFGDEAGAGLALGPYEVNHKYQNSGIEKLIRELAERVAPHRADNLHFKLRAEMTTWGNPTPKGLTTDSKEPLFRSATYTMELTTPSGTVSHSVTIRLNNDPLDIAKGADPDVFVTPASEIKDGAAALYRELELWVPT
ncbi:MAG: polymorphic toxin type 4 domain-containing protein [Sulfitobacter sp.]